MIRLEIMRLNLARFSISIPLHKSKYEFVDRHFRLPPGATFASSPIGSSIGTNRFKQNLNHFIGALDTQNLVAKCDSFGIPKDVYSKAIKEFRHLLANDEIPYLRHEDIKAHMQVSSPIEKLVLPAFFRFVRINFPDSVKMLKLLSSKLDLENPSMLFPDTRLIKREIIMHVGPTNSGKTHSALKSFAEAETAVYCGPLRLLAHEIYERMNKNNVECNLLTGEDRKESSHVHKWACTIEMTPLNRTFDVAVIDEIQVIADRDRGFAWTNALLGIQAKKIHVCGEEAAVELVQDLCKLTGDDLTINRYKRLTPLKVLQKSLGSSFKNMKKGDAVIAFSRSQIFGIKRIIERKTDLRAAVIYGSLPPEPRSEQARLFNDPNSGYDVLVASDAVGMGLNLNIKRIIFNRLSKYDGRVIRNLTVSETKQIAGRAGRFGTEFSEGEVTTLDKVDIKNLHNLMRMAGLAPTLSQLEFLAKSFPMDKVSSLLSKFEDLALLSGKFFLCSLDCKKIIADAIEDTPMELKDRYLFLQAPIKPDEAQVMDFAKSLAYHHSKGIDFNLEEHIIIPDSPASDQEGVRILEIVHFKLMLYVWTAFSGVFSSSLDLGLSYKIEIERLINESLFDLDFSVSRSPKNSSKFLDEIDESR